MKVEERFQALVDSLLGRTVVVDTVDHALSLSRKNNFSLRLVTLDGELLNPGGAITGGVFGILAIFSVESVRLKSAKIL